MAQQGYYRFRDEWNKHRQECEQSADRFRLDFRRSGMSSIDQFLEHNPEWMEHGKFAIARVLVPIQDQHLYGGNAASHWHGWVFEQLLRQADRLDDEQVSFVTFNYDRLLHCGLYSMAKYGLNKGDEEIQRILQKFPIHHVYGFLNVEYFNHVDRVPPAPGELSEPAQQDRIAFAARSIQVVPEGRNDASRYEKCRSLLASADIVIFVGFGFDRVNLDRIGALGIATQRTMVLANCFGLEQSELRRVETLLSGGASVMLGQPGADCLRFLRSHIAHWIEDLS
jgi:hypothetical protein